MKKIISLYGLLCFCLLPALAQVSFEKRIELHAGDGFEEQQVYSFGQKGFLLHAQNQEISRVRNTWKYTLFDTNLIAIDSTLSFVPKRQGLAATYRDQERMHSLYKDKKGNFNLETLDLESSDIQSISGKIPKKTAIREMICLKDMVFLRGETKKSPFLYAINWKTGEQKRLKIDLEHIDSRTITLKNFQLLSQAEEVLLFMTRKIHKKRSEMYFLSLDAQGKQGDIHHLSKVMLNNIIDASASKISPNNYMLTGTYSTSDTDESEGIYFCEIKEGQTPQIKYYRFTDLHNFFSYLPAKKAMKIERKKKRKEKAGKEFKPNYRIASHEILPVEDGYLYIGEAYYETEEYQEITSFAPNGASSSICITTFDGYQYTHAVIAKFDHNQQLLWDESFAMWPSYKPFSVQRFISIAEQDQEQLKLIFTSHNKVHTKRISLDEPEQQFTEKETFQTPYEGDKPKRTLSHVDFWYDKYFIAFGSQKIKNKVQEDKPKKRKVFFVSKIGFE